MIVRLVLTLLFSFICLSTVHAELGQISVEPVNVNDVEIDFQPGLSKSPTLLEIDGAPLISSGRLEDLVTAYYFKVVDEAEVTIELTNLETDLDLSVHDQYLTSLGESTLGEDSSEEIRKSLKPGIYIARIFSFDEPVTSNYRLTIAGRTPVPFVPTIENDPGHDFARAHLLGKLSFDSPTVITQTITPGDQDAYRFKLPDGADWPTNVKLSLTEVNPSVTDLVIDFGEKEIGHILEIDTGAQGNESGFATIGGSEKEFIVLIRGFNGDEEAEYKLTIDITQ